MRRRYRKGNLIGWRDCAALMSAVAKTRGGGGAAFVAAAERALQDLVAELDGRLVLPMYRELALAICKDAPCTLEPCPDRPGWLQLRKGSGV